MQRQRHGVVVCEARRRWRPWTDRLRRIRTQREVEDTETESESVEENGGFRGFAVGRKGGDFFQFLFFEIVLAIS